MRKVLAGSIARGMENSRFAAYLLQRSLDQSKPKRKAVITGIGVVTPIGIGKQEFWENLLCGKTGISKISQFDASGFPSQIAGEVKNFDPLSFLSKAQIKRFSRVTQFACASAIMALKDSGLEYLDPYRTDVIMGSATCAFDELDKQVFRNPTGGQKWSRCQE